VQHRRVAAADAHADQVPVGRACEYELVDHANRRKVEDHDLAGASAVCNPQLGDDTADPHDVQWYYVRQESKQTKLRVEVVQHACSVDLSGIFYCRDRANICAGAFTRLQIAMR
jgi:hypothetical protein